MTMNRADDTGTVTANKSRTARSVRQRRVSTPAPGAVPAACALLLAAAFVPCSSCAGVQGGHGSPSRPPLIPGLDRRGEGGGGSRRVGGAAEDLTGNDNDRRTAIPTPMLARVDANLHTRRQDTATARGISAGSIGGRGGSTAGSGGVLRSTKSTKPTESIKTWRDNNNNSNNDHRFESSSASSRSNYPEAGQRDGTSTGNYPARVPPSSNSYGAGYFDVGVSTSHGRSDALAAERRRALSAAGRSDHHTGPMRPVLFEHRAGGSGGSGAEQQSNFQQGAEYQPNGDVFVDGASMIGDEEPEGLAPAEEMSRVQDPQYPPRTPLQEQVRRDQEQYLPPGKFSGEPSGTQQQRASSLFRRAGGGGVFFVFFILVWRSLSNYEHVEQMAGGLRATMLIPAVALLLGNVVCLCLSLVQSATTRQKARMKTMLGIDAFAEGILLMYNLLALLGGSGEAHLAREEFISRLLANAWFLSICFTFAKARWVADGAW